jgi:membrane-associated protease RseP (regulator of RpoE activity)
MASTFSLLSMIGVEKMKRCFLIAAMFVFLSGITVLAEAAGENQSKDWPYGPYDKLHRDAVTVDRGSLTQETGEEWLSSFGGIGAVIDAVNEGVLVKQVLSGSPAARADLRAGDVIVEIDGHPAAGLSTSDVVARLRGKPGSIVSLKVRRAADGLVQSMQLKRDIITLPTVFKPSMEETPFHTAVGPSEQNAILPFREAHKALEKAFEYIDAGKVQYKDATVKHDDVEPLSVSYDFDQREKLITVNFRVKSAVRSNYVEHVDGVLSIRLDEQGRLRGQNTGEWHGGVPTKEWKITP